MLTISLHAELITSFANLTAADFRDGILTATENATQGFTVEMDLRETVALSVVLPDGVSSSQTAIALHTLLCADTSDCSVTVASRQRHRRVLLSGSSFSVTRTPQPTRTLNPHILNSSNLAAMLGTNATRLIVSQPMLISVHAIFTLIGLGDQNDVAAMLTSPQSPEVALSSAIAAWLGVDVATVAVEELRTVFPPAAPPMKPTTAPHPPPRAPPAPPSPAPIAPTLDPFPENPLGGSGTALTSLGDEVDTVVYYIIFASAFGLLCCFACYNRIVFFAYVHGWTLIYKRSTQMAFFRDPRGFIWGVPTALRRLSTWTSRVFDTAELPAGNKPPARPVRALPPPVDNEPPARPAPTPVPQWLPFPRTEPPAGALATLGTAEAGPVAEAGLVAEAGPVAEVDVVLGAPGAPPPGLHQPTVVDSDELSAPTEVHIVLDAPAPSMPSPASIPGSGLGGGCHETVGHAPPGSSAPPPMPVALRWVEACLTDESGPLGAATLLPREQGLCAEPAALTPQPLLDLAPPLPERVAPPIVTPLTLTSGVRPACTINQATPRTSGCVQSRIERIRGVKAARRVAATLESVASMATTPRRAQRTRTQLLRGQRTDSPQRAASTERPVSRWRKALLLLKPPPLKPQTSQPVAGGQCCRATAEEVSIEWTSRHGETLEAIAYDVPYVSRQNTSLTLSIPGRVTTEERSAASPGGNSPGSSPGGSSSSARMRQLATSVSPILRIPSCKSPKIVDAAVKS